MSTFVLPDGRSETTRVPAGLTAGDKFSVVIPAPVPFTVVVPEGKMAGNEIEYNGPDVKRRKVTMPCGFEEGKPDTLQIDVTRATNFDDVASTALSESILHRNDGLECCAGWDGLEVLSGVSSLFHVPTSRVESSFLLKYRDRDGDLCTLTEITRTPSHIRVRHDRPTYLCRDLPASPSLIDPPLWSPR